MLSPCQPKRKPRPGKVQGHKACSRTGSDLDRLGPLAVCGVEYGTEGMHPGGPVEKMDDRSVIAVFAVKDRKK